jgi:hypothetical protein
MTVIETLRRRFPPRVREILAKEILAKEILAKEILARELLVEKRWKASSVGDCATDPGVD